MVYNIVYYTNKYIKNSVVGVVKLLDNQLLEFYNGFLISIIICYIIYILSKDLKRASTLNYILSSLFISITVFLLNYMYTNMFRMNMLILLVLVITFVIKFFHKFNIYDSALIAAFAMILYGFSEFFTTIVYIMPLKIPALEYRRNLLHISVGGALSFVFTCIALRFIADKFIKIRIRIYKKYNKLIVLLTANIITVFVLMVFISSMLGFYTDFKKILTNTNYTNIVVIFVVLIASVVGTIYIINYHILNNMKFDRLKKNYVMDTMTDTLNRGAGLCFIENELKKCKKLNTNLTICYIDINDLKIVNDSLGHKEGDHLIKAIVRAIKENIRETDVICRLGGDEFVIVFPNCNIEYGEKVMKRISKQVNQLKLFKTGKLTSSISYGFSDYLSDAENTVDSLLDKADHQMYLNKRAIKQISNALR